MNRVRLLWLLVLVLAWLLTACNLPSEPNPGESPQASPVVEVTATPANATQTPALPTPTITPTPLPSVADDQLLAVVLLPETEVLTLHAQPGEGAPVVASVDPRASGLAHQRNLQIVEGAAWLEITTPEGVTGWANTRYLTAQVSAEAFCLDTRVNELVTQFSQAVQKRDGQALAQLASPTHGLRIRHEWWNPEVVFATPQEIAVLFSDITSREWGLGDGSGLPIQGTFNEVILPGLDDVLGQASPACNTLEQGLAAGGTAGFIEWPFEYANFNYVSVYRPAPPGDELNWRTWAIGIEFVAGQPYIVALVQYHWEI